MPNIQLHPTDCTREVLPARCVVTGSTDDVVWRPVPLEDVAMLPLGIVTLFRSRTLEAELPFTPAAYRAWRRSRLLALVNVALTLALVLAAGQPAARALVGDLLLALPILVPTLFYAALIRGRGPRCVSLTRHRVMLWIPSRTTAREIASRLAEVDEVRARAAALGTYPVPAWRLAST